MASIYSFRNRLLTFAFIGFESVMTSGALAGGYDRAEYRDLINQTNQKLNQIKETRSCPGVALALSCGDGVCNRDEGENEQTCAQDCVTASVKSYDSQTFCTEVKRLFIPNSVEAVQEAIKYAISNKLHVRVIGSAHSVNSQYCTDGVVISTQRLNQVIGLENGGEGVWVQPGLTLGALTEWLHTRGKSLGYAVMGFRGMTVGGAIATGAHGSSLKHCSVISSSVTAAKLVDGEGHLVELSEENGDSEVLKGVRANLGMLGVVTQIRLKIRPQFNLHVRVTDFEDERIKRKNGLWNEVSNCDFGELNWFPNTGRVVKICGVETKKSPDPGAGNVLLKPDVPSGLVSPYKVALHYGACSSPLNFLLEGLRYLTFKFQPPFKKADALGNAQNTADVVGLSHRMMSSILLPDRRGFFQTDWAFAVPFSKAQAVIQYFSSYAQENRINLPMIGVFLRFGKSEDRTLLAHSASYGAFHPREPVLFFEFPVSNPVGLPRELAQKFHAPYEQFARILVTRFQARAHWGKNFDWVFELENNLRVYGKNLEKFREIEERLDPNGIFANSFSRVSGLSSP